MNLIALTSVRAQMRSGVPLPWGVRDSNGKLLLAKGYVIPDDNMLEHLMERGMFVDAEEVRTVMSRLVREPSPKRFFSRWQELQAQLVDVLHSPAEAQFLARLHECVDLLGNLSTHNADQVIYSIVRHDHERYARYGTSHALHVAAVCVLLGRKLEWPSERLESLMGAALTMNLSMLDLQGVLAASGARPTPEQAQEIRTHPTRSADLLRAAGLTDAEWLSGIEQHHEDAEGKGYPHGIQADCEISQFLRYIDTFTAKHAGRAGRLPMPAQQAARELYISSKGHPIAALLIKEFGIYPPGCFVKLASGENAIVTRRGAAANAPEVMAITRANGQPWPQPITRDTANPDFAVIGNVASHAVMTKLPVERLYDANL